MTTPVLDPALYSVRAGSWTQSAVDDHIADQSEIGEARVRARSTAIRRTFSFVVVTTNPANTAALDTFFTQTVRGQLVPFLFTHPYTGTVHTVRLTGYPEQSKPACAWAVFPLTLREVA